MRVEKRTVLEVAGVLAAVLLLVGVVVVVRRSLVGPEELGAGDRVGNAGRSPSSSPSEAGKSRDAEKESRDAVAGGAAPSADSRPVLASGVPMAPVELRTGLLFDCYEHVRENVPPRNDTSARQRSWAAPALPLRAVGRLTNEERSSRVAAWLQTWEAEWAAGKTTEPARLADLSMLLGGTSSPFALLQEIGIAISFLDGDEHGAVWMRHAMAAAARETEGLQPSDPRCDEYLRLMVQSRALWRVKDWRTLAVRYGIEQRLLTMDTREGRKAAHLQAEMYYNLGEHAQMARITKLMEAKHREFGDLTIPDQEEMNWIFGLFYFYGGMYEESIPYWKIVAESGHGTRARQAAGMLVAAQERVKSGRGKAAK